VYQKLLSNSRGSAILLVLFVFIGIMGYTLYFIQSAKLQSRITTQTRNDVNVTNVTAAIRSLLSDPVHCNGNFRSRSAIGSLTLPGIRTCNGGDCFAFNSSMEAYTVNTTSWPIAMTPTQRVPPNIRITELKYQITTPQQDTDYNQPYKPAIAKLDITFEKKNNTAISKVQTSLDVLVVTNPAKTLIVGCPKDPNSTDSYGDPSCHYPWVPWAAKIDNGSSIQAYSATTAPSCAAIRETRVCNNTVLSGSNIYQNCTDVPAPAVPSVAVDGGWGAWYPINTCPVCGVGSQMHYRDCNNPAPSGGGASCSGPNNVNSPCIITACSPTSSASVDGGWSDWVSSSCMSSCGPGHLMKYRFCNQPEPQNGGANCPGFSVDVVECNLGPCP
jgi:hypothetical protein